MTVTLPPLRFGKSCPGIGGFYCFLGIPGVGRSKERCAGGHHMKADHQEAASGGRSHRDSQPPVCVLGWGVGGERWIFSHFYGTELSFL